MKVCVISNTDPGRFEKDVNDFLKNVHVVDVKVNSSMYENESGVWSTFSAIIAYEEFK